jgi:hypothetical protein
VTSKPPHFLYNRLTGGGGVSFIHRPAKKIPGNYLFQRLSQQPSNSVAGRNRSIEESTDITIFLILIIAEFSSETSVSSLNSTTFLSSECDNQRIRLLTAEELPLYCYSGNGGSYHETAFILRVRLMGRDSVWFL